MVSFKSVYSMVYWLENEYMTTSTRPCQFSQGDIYRPQGRWSNIWGLDEPEQDSQGFQGVNPTYLTTARLSGISFEISPFKNSHDLLWNVNDHSLCFMPLLNDTNNLSRKKFSLRLTKYGRNLTSCMFAKLQRQIRVSEADSKPCCMKLIATFFRA